MVERIEYSLVSRWQFAIDDILRDLRLDLPFCQSDTNSEEACGSALLQISGMLEALPPPPSYYGPQGLIHPLLRMGLPPRPFSRVLSRSVAVWAATGRFCFPQLEDACPPGLTEVPEGSDTVRRLSEAMNHLSQLLTQLFSLPVTSSGSSDDGDCMDDMPEAAEAVTAVSPQHDIGPRSPEAAPITSTSTVLRFIDSQPGVRCHPLWACSPLVSSQSQPAAAEALRLVEQIKACVGEVLHDPANVFMLLGCRLTVGTSRDPGLMPSLEEVVEAFVRRQSPPPSTSPLTVGARALAKHTHRDVTSSWWGPCTGSEPEKNAAALSVLSRILAGVVWINLHHMPPRKNVLEVRVEKLAGGESSLVLSASLDILHSEPILQ